MADTVEGAARPKQTPTASAPKKQRHPPRPRHIPQRTCAACRQVRPKRELLRIVRTPDGHVVLDPTGKKSGRGTYLCARRSCWDLALKKGRLEQALSVTLLPEDRAALEAYRETLPPEDAPAPAAPRRKKTPPQPAGPPNLG
jgi:predicted RNA-binding protein YlxR (DUF448 family)